jgi:hypothetical protein
MSETRKLAAILAADVVGYSRLTGADEGRTLARLWGLPSDLIDPAFAAALISTETPGTGSTRPQFIQAGKAVYHLRLSASDPAHAKGGCNVQEVT